MKEYRIRMVKPDGSDCMAEFPGEHTVTWMSGRYDTKAAANKVVKELRTAWMGKDPENYLGRDFTQKFKFEDGKPVIKIQSRTVTEWA